MSVPIRVQHAGHELAGIAADGEGWAAAAERIAASAASAPAARDLSGEVKRFVLDDRQVSLRPMTRGDLPELARWRRAEHVRRWWVDAEEPTDEFIASKYADDVDGRTPTRLWVVEVHGRSVGMVQDYRIRDHPDFALLTPDPDAVGLDYLIGEPAYVGRGIGTLMLWAWLRRVPRRFPDVRHCFAAPDHRHEASLRLLDRVGFRRGTWFDERLPDGSTATVVGCSLDVHEVLGRP